MAVQRAGQRHGHARALGHRQSVIVVPPSPRRRPFVPPVVTFPESHDAALTGGGQQRAVLGEHVHQTVAEATLDGVHADVEQHPLGGHQVHDAQRVVEAVATAAHAERLADAHRHEVAEHRQRRPRRRRRSRRGSAPTSASVRRRACRRASSNGRPFAIRCSSRSLMRAVDRHRGTVARGHSSGGGTSGIVSHWPLSSSGRWPSAALTVRISRLPTWHTARACVIWWPSTASVTSMSITSPGLA